MKSSEAGTTAMGIREEAPRLPGKWPDWQLEEIIGEHGPVTVYRAVRTDEAGTSYSAVKILRVPENEYRTRYIDEIRIMLSLKGHPNIVAIEDYATEHEDGFVCIYIRMELLTPLDKYIAANDFGEDDLIRAGIELCNALEHCRRKHILHLDIKPSNIFVTDDGHFKLGDFGISRSFDDLSSRPFTEYTPNFMGPELYHYMKREGLSGGEPVSVDQIGDRYDQYSLGLVLYWIRNGQKAPFLPDRLLTPEDRSEAFRRRMAGEALPPLENTSADLAKVIFRASAYDPADRYSGLAEMRKELEKLLKGSGAAGPGKRIAAGIGALLACAVLAALYFILRPGNTDVPVVTPTLPPATTPSPDSGEADAFGNCGEDLIWQVNGSVLRIYGTGGMYDYNSTSNRPPWEEYRDRITRVVVEEGVTKIGKYAFFESGELAEVELPHSLRRINNMAFGYCYNLPRLVIPEGVEHIETSIIYRCPKLTGISLPGTMKLIEGSFAGECESLETITLGEGCTAYAVQDGVLFDSTMEELICHPAGLGDVAYAIPEKVRTIGVYAFAENKNLAEITIPDGVTAIESCAFTGCRNLKRVTVPESVRTLGNYAFYGCEKLTGIQLPSGIEWIDQQAFYDCYSLQEIVIPPKVKRIGTAVFGNCPGLNRIVIPPSVESISKSAFDGSPNVVIVCESGSYAEQYAAEHGMAVSNDME